MISLHNPQGPQPGQAPFKFTVTETCDRIKEEFSFLQAQIHRYEHVRAFALCEFRLTCESGGTARKLANCPLNGEGHRLQVAGLLQIEPN